MTAENYTITASSDANSTITPSGAITVTEGDSQTFTYTANQGYNISQVIVDGIVLTPPYFSGTYTFNDVAANHAISVSSSPIQSFSFSATLNFAPYASCPTCGFNYAIPLNAPFNVANGDSNAFSPYSIPDHVNQQTGGACASANAVQDVYIAVHYDPAGGCVYFYVGWVPVSGEWWLGI